MAGRNKSVRKAILVILFESDEPLTKTQVLESLEKQKGRFLLNSQPTSNSIGSLLAKSSQIIRGEEISVFAGDGRNRKTPTFLINRSLIKCEEDLLLTTPYKLLSQEDQKRCNVCVECARMRILSSETLCLECHRATQE